MSRKSKTSFFFFFEYSFLLIEPETKTTEPVHSLVHTESVESTSVISSQQQVPKPTPRLSKSYTNETNNSSITQDDLPSTKLDSHTSFEHETSSQISSTTDTTSDSFNQRKEFWDTLDNAKKQLEQETPPVPKPRQGISAREDSKSIETDTSSIRDIPDFKQDPREDSFNVDDRLEDESFPLSDVSESLKSHDHKKKDLSTDEKQDKEDSISVSLKGEYVERHGDDTEPEISEHGMSSKQLSKDAVPSLDEDDSPAAFYIGDKSDNIITKSATQKRDEFAFDNEGYQLSHDDVAVDDDVPCKTDFVHQGLEIYDDRAINIKSDSELEKHLIRPDIDEEKMEEEAIEEEIQLEHAKNAISVEKSETETSEKKDVPSVLELDSFETPKEKQWKPIVHSPIEKVIQLEKPVEFGQEVTTAKATAIEVIKEAQGTQIKHPSSFEKIIEVSKDLTRTQELAVDQAFEEIKDSLDAVQEELIEVVKDGKLIKQSPSEFEISLLPHQQVLESHPEEQAPQDSSFDKPTSLIKVQAPSESEDSSLRQDSSADESLNKLEVVRRSGKKSPASGNRWSVTDPETGSDETSSYYQSLERTDTDRSRPQSSDFSNLVVTTGSEYETAHSQSTIPVSGATDYHSAISTLHTPSMKSFDSESSGNLASIEASEASETLVPSQMEECEADILPGQDEEDLVHDDSEKSGSLEEKQPGVLLEAESLSSSLKRSHEMIFHDDAKSSSVERLDDIKRIDEHQKFASSIEDVKFGSLEDGSLLSVSLSSASNIETVMENMPEGSDIVDSLLGSYDSGKVYLSRSTDDAATTPVELTEHERIETLTMTSSVMRDQTQSFSDVNTQISTTITSSTLTLESQDQESADQERNKRKGHRRNDSTSVHPIGLFAGGTDETQPSSFDSSELEDEMIVHEEEPKHAFPVPALSGGDRDESSDSDYDRYESEYARSFRLPNTQVRKKEKRDKLEEILPELDIKRSRSPSYSTIETIVEDVHAELEEHAPIERRVSPNIQNIPDIQVTDDIVASSEDELPVEKFRQEIEARTATSPVQYAQQVEYKMTEEQYHEIIDKKYKAQEIERYGGYDSEEDKPPSPGSDSFEMLEQPDISDEFVIVEEVAKEAQEFDSEGKGMGIQKIKREKKHDEDVERMLVKSAPASTDASQIYAHHEDVPFDFEESPPMDQDHESTGTRDIGNGYPLEGSKRWVEMQLNDPGNLRYPYDLQGGILEDIKEEDTDFEVGSSRISSFKDSFSSTPDYDSIARKLHARENDNISMSSLQEFESLEQVISLENKKQAQSSQESLSNGSSGGKQKVIRIHGDDISMSSLKEFEALENASLEAVLLEIKAKEEAALLLSRSDESNRSDSSNGKKPQQVAGKIVTTTVTTTTTSVQHGVGPQKITATQVTKTESSLPKQQHDDDDSLNVMEVSTDSLEGSSKPSKSLYDKESGQHASTDSLERNNTNADVMSSSIDSIEVQKGGGTTTKSTSRSDSIEQALNDVRKSESIDSIELQQAIARQRIDRDSLDEQHAYELHTTTTTTSGGRQIVTHTLTETTTHVIPSEMQKEFSSDSINSATSTQEPLLTSTESIETGSTATNATFTNDGNSQMSGSMTSCDSTTLIDNTDIRVSSSLMFEELGGHFVRSPYDPTGRNTK